MTVGQDILETSAVGTAVVGEMRRLCGCQLKEQNVVKEILTSGPARSSKLAKDKVPYWMCVQFSREYT